MKGVKLTGKVLRIDLASIEDSVSFFSPISSLSLPIRPPFHGPLAGFALIVSAPFGPPKSSSMLLALKFLCRAEIMAPSMLFRLSLMGETLFPFSVDLPSSKLEVGSFIPVRRARSSTDTDPLREDMERDPL